MPIDPRCKFGDGRSVHPVAVVTQEVGTELPVRLREPHQSPRYTLRVFDDASQCAGDSNQPFDPGRVGLISELEPVPLTAPPHGPHRSGSARPFVPIHPFQHLDPAPDRSRGLGQRLSFGIADSLLGEAPRDRAGYGDELIGRCGHRRSCEAARHCLGVGAFRQPLARRGQTRFEEAHRPALPVRQPVGVASLGTNHAGQPGRRGSRDSGQTANMVLAVVQIETVPVSGSADRHVACR